MLEKPILIAYATRGGTTQKVAETVARAMRKHQVLVEVRPIEQVSDVSPYRAVVVGSGVRDEKWLPEAVHFVKNHQQALKKLPLLYFLVYSVLLGEFPQRTEEVLSELSEVRQLVEPLEVAIFSRDPQTLSTKMLVNAKAMPEGSWSGWENLETWASRVHKEFGQAAIKDS